MFVIIRVYVEHRKTKSGKLFKNNISFVFVINFLIDP